MIVDGRCVIVRLASSSVFSRRTTTIYYIDGLREYKQKGDGNSEIALVVEDTDELESGMGGSRVRADLAFSSWCGLVRRG
jgi:hypothetical protein